MRFYNASYTPHYMNSIQPTTSNISILKLLRCSAPVFLGYVVFAVSVIIFLIFHVAPTHGTTNVFVYLAICSLAGSLTVMSCKVGGHRILRRTVLQDLLYGHTYPVYHQSLSLQLNPRHSLMRLLLFHSIHFLEFINASLHSITSYIIRR